MKRFFLCVVLVLTWCWPTCGQTAGVSFYMGEVFPFTYVTEDGMRAGAAVELVSTIMRRAGHSLNVRNIHVLNWARSVEEVANTPNTALFCVARTPQRENLFKWVGPIGESNVGLVAKKSANIHIGDNSELSRYRIGVVRNSAPAQILMDLYGYPEEQFQYLSSGMLQFRMLEAGRVDLITQADVSAPRGFRNAGIDPSDYEIVSIVKKVPLYIAFNPATDDFFLESLRDALQQLKKKNPDGTSRYEDILGAYGASERIAIRKP